MSFVPVIFAAVDVPSCSFLVFLLSQRIFPLLPQKHLPLLPTPTATAPKKGMIRLTALQAELENPRRFFNCSSASSKSSTSSLGRSRRSPVSRSVEPRSRVCGVSYKPESLHDFGRQMTMFELHRTVDSLIEDSVKVRYCSSELLFLNTNYWQ